MVTMDAMAGGGHDDEGMRMTHGQGVGLRRRRFIDPDVMPASTVVWRAFGLGAGIASVSMLLGGAVVWFLIGHS